MVERYRDLGVPSSWYRAAWSHELAQQVVPLRYFGCDLVAYRTASGEPVVMDAFCQHLGAHLGYGGTVSGDCIVCPFHGWEWGSDGTNRHIPYASTTVRRTIRTWEVVEANGVVWVWYDKDGKPPTWTVPVLPEHGSDGYTGFDEGGCRTWPNVAVHPVQPAENTADPAHIRFIHGAGVVPSVDRFGAEGHVFSTTLRYVWGAGHESTWLTPDGPVEGELRADCHGLGLIVTRYTGIPSTVQITGCTPIDQSSADYYTALLVDRSAGDDLRQRLLRHFYREVEADFPVWENMSRIEHPPFPRLESKVMRQMRGWTNQFLTSA